MQKKLESEAINAAKRSDWEAAVAINKSLLESFPSDVNALNRLGFAYLQLQKTRLASQTFQTVLRLEKSNPIAIKQLANIKAKNITAPEFGSENFVEEPSKSKIVTLHRLAGKQVLENLSVGQELSFKLKNRFISVETTDKTYLGSLPEDISLHLSGLINNGNRYQALLHSCSGKHCSVFIKEIYQSPANKDYHSFVSNYLPDKDEAVGEDLLLLADDVPMSIVDDETETIERDGQYAAKDS
jgi:hypothetical protein